VNRSYVVAAASPRAVSMATYVVLGTGSAAVVAVGRCASRHARPSEVDAAPAVRHVAVAVPAGPEVPGRRCPREP
jgi:hypothetical protein